MFWEKISSYWSKYTLTNIRHTFNVHFLQRFGITWKWLDALHKIPHTSFVQLPGFDDTLHSFMCQCILNWTHGRSLLIWNGSVMSQTLHSNHLVFSNAYICWFSTLLLPSQEGIKLAQLNCWGNEYTINQLLRKRHSLAVFTF